MPRYSVKIRKTIIQNDEVIINAVDRTEAECLVKDLCFKDGYAGSLLGEHPRKIFSFFGGWGGRPTEKLEILDVTQCVHPEVDPSDAPKPTLHLSIE